MEIKTNKEILTTITLTEAEALIIKDVLWYAVKASNLLTNHGLGYRLSFLEKSTADKLAYNIKEHLNNNVTYDVNSSYPSEIVNYGKWYGLNKFKETLNSIYGKNRKVKKGE